MRVAIGCCSWRPLRCGCRCIWHTASRRPGRSGPAINSRRLLLPLLLRLLVLLLLYLLPLLLPLLLLLLPVGLSCLEVRLHLGHKVGRQLAQRAATTAGRRELV